MKLNPIRNPHSGTNKTDKKSRTSERDQKIESMKEELL